MKNLLIIKGAKDICDVEVCQIKTIAGMFSMNVIEQLIDTVDALEQLATHNCKFDYIYLAAHANPNGFGDPEGYFVSWYDFSTGICPLDIVSSNAVFLLACCRGGVEKVGYDIFAGCDKIEYVCGPRWKVAAPDLTAGFHAFIYNMEFRRLQPDQAAKRASDATGYDFLWYDRVDIERTPEFKRHQMELWGLPVSKGAGITS